VWTKRFGNNPKIKVLLLHGGPGGTHEFFESFESFFPQEGIEFYEYDQLGSYFSDQPKDSSLWVTERFVEEVEQVRKALGLNKDNFYLLGHSWGGILAMEYALKYQDNLKGLSDQQYDERCCCLWKICAGCFIQTNGPQSA
jgi:proline iminopeptidase